MTLDHPFVTKYVDHFIHDDRAHIVMEYAEGGTFEKFLKDN